MSIALFHRSRLAPTALRLEGRRWPLLLPALFVLVVFLLLPIVLMVLVSFLPRAKNGGVLWGEFTDAAYVNFLFEENLDGSWSFNADYLLIFGRSLLQSLVTTLLCLVAAIPTALYMAMQQGRYRTLLVFLITIPFWVNLLIRNYSWILILRTNGLLDSLLMGFGVTSESLDLLYTDYAVAMGLLYSFLPFMVLPIYASMEKLDWSLVEAAYDLGANRWRAVRRVILPLSAPGLRTGCLLVFIPCLGAYATPVLLGGGKALMIGNLIEMQFGGGRNWPFGAAIGFILLALVLLTLVAYALWTGRGGGRLIPALVR